MTNGEKIKEIFPDIEFTDMAFTVHAVAEATANGVKGHISYDFWKYWWNAEYKEPITENEAKYCDRNICLKNEYNNIGCEDCEVTKSQKPTTKNNLGVDCISREDALMCLTGKFENREYEPSELIKMFAKKIKTLPSVTPQEPKTGYWIFCEGIKGKDNVEKCSCCQSHWKEAVIYRKDTQEYLRTRLLYCPNCGAKMVEPQESEEV